MQITGLEMKQLRKNMFSFPHGDGFEALLRRLSKKFIIEDFSHEVTQRVYYDTFDWRLHRANQVFFFLEELPHPKLRMAFKVTNFQCADTFIVHSNAKGLLPAGV